MAEIDLGLDLYGFNKAGMAQEKPLDSIALNIKLTDMFNDIMNRNDTNKSSYWMLLCRERHDYTIFLPLTLTGSVSEMTECLINRGQVLSIDKQKDKNYEIWIRDPETKENYVYYFFDYNQGIIKA